MLKLNETSLVIALMEQGGYLQCHAAQQYGVNETKISLLVGVSEAQGYWVIIPEASTFTLCHDAKIKAYTFHTWKTNSGRKWTWYIRLHLVTGTQMINQCD